MPVEFGIQKNRTGNNLRDLHVELRVRVRALFALAAAEGLGELMVYSAARTYEHQKQLFDDYEDRGRTHPIVANPDLGFGSKHQTRPANRYKHGNLPANRTAAYAVDIQWVDLRVPTAQERDTLRELAQRCGLAKTVPTEFWHFEPSKNFPVSAVAGYGWTGQVVVKLQHELNEAGDAGLMPDEQFGPATLGAVIEFQQQHGLPVTGDWTNKDQEALTKALRNAATPKRVNRPNVAGVESNPTEYQTLRLARRRAVSARNELDEARQAIRFGKVDDADVLIARARQRIDEVARLIHHEQND